MYAMYLTALIPPSNIAREVALFQEHIFRRYGVAAGRVLPPHIAIRFNRQSPPKPDLKKQCQPAILQTAGIVRSGSSVFLSVEPEPVIHTISEWCSPSDAEAPYRAGVGFFIADALMHDASWPAVNWSTSTLRCYELSINSPNAWWENCYYEEVWSVKVRRFLRE